MLGHAISNPPRASPPPETTNRALVTVPPQIQAQESTRYDVTCFPQKNVFPSAFMVPPETYSQSTRCDVTSETYSQSTRCDVTSFPQNVPCSSSSSSWFPLAAAAACPPPPSSGPLPSTSRNSTPFVPSHDLLQPCKGPLPPALLNNHAP